MRRIIFFVMLVLLLCLTAGTAYAKDNVKPVIKNVEAQKEVNGLGDVPVYFETSEKVKVTVKLFKGSKLVKTFTDKSVKNEDRLYWVWTWSGKKTDGNYKVIIYAVDYAGNKAASKKVNIKVDSVSPRLTGVTVTDDPFIPDGVKKKEVKFTLKDEAYVYVQVYDYNKKDVMVHFENLGKKKPGTYKYSWDGKVYGEYTAPTASYRFKIGAYDNAYNRTEVYSKKFNLKNQMPPEIYNIRFDEYFKASGTEERFLRYGLSRKANVNIALYKKGNGTNTFVKNLFNGTVDENYSNPVMWDGKDENGSLIITDTLFVVITAKDENGKQSTTTSRDFIPLPNDYDITLKSKSTENGLSLEGNYYFSGKSISIRIVNETWDVVKEIFAGEQASGTNSFTWDGTDDAGNHISDFNGYYLIIRPLDDNYYIEPTQINLAEYFSIQH